MTPKTPSVRKLKKNFGHERKVEVGGSAKRGADLTDDHSGEVASDGTQSGPSACYRYRQGRVEHGRKMEKKPKKTKKKKKRRAEKAFVPQRREDGTYRPLVWDCRGMRAWGGASRLCRNWRCQNVACFVYANKKDAWRIEQALRKPDAEGKPIKWFFWVLTLAPWAHKSRKPQDNFVKWAPRFKELQKKIKAEIGLLNTITVMEMHSSMQPHANNLVTNDWLQTATDEQIKKLKRLIQDEAPSHAFGYRVSFTEVKETDIPRISRYFTKAQIKIHATDSGITGEMVKGGYQMPLMMPRSFNRLRSSPGLLPDAKLYDEVWKQKLNNMTEEEKQRSEIELKKKREYRVKLFEIKDDFRKNGGHIHKLKVVTDVNRALAVQREQEQKKQKIEEDRLKRKEDDARAEKRLAAYRAMSPLEKIEYQDKIVSLFSKNRQIWEKRDAELLAEQLGEKPVVRRPGDEDFEMRRSKKS